jgi:MerR family mercuric resistance operon transcriptional regulator
LKQFTSGKLADTVGVNRETIRFYERGGLMSPPGRTSGGYRVYHESDVRRLRFILRSKSLGFTLAEIGELLSIADGRLVRCASVKKIADQRLKQIDRQIADLMRLRVALRTLVRRCSTRRSVTGCPIIDTLSDGESSDAN